MLGLFKLLPLVLQLISSIMSWAKSAQDRGLGRTEAIAEALQESTKAVDEANKARQEAAARHAADPTDTAFDDGFQRKE